MAVMCNKKGFRNFNLLKPFKTFKLFTAFYLKEYGKTSMFSVFQQMSTKLRYLVVLLL